MSKFISSRFLTAVLLSFMCVPVLAVTVSPSAVTISENASQQFTASAPVTWTASCGTISSAGLFRAPLYPGTCSVTAQATDHSGSATASVTLVSPIIMTPVSAKTPQGQTQQFTSNVPVTWIAKCGTITAGGLYTATPAVGTICTIEGIATGSVQYIVYGYDSTIAPISAFTISPLSPTLTEGASLQFTPSAASTFTATCGKISASGLYTAPLVPANCTVTANATDGSGHTASTTAIATSPLAIMPGPVVVTRQGQTQQFTANVPVIWAASCGAINAAGLFTASAASGSTCTITATAATGPAYTAGVADTIGQAPTLTIGPLLPSLTEGAIQQFTSNIPATWAATCGTVGASTGMYTAPLVPGSCTVTANATDGSGQITSTTATVVSPIVMTPVSAKTPQGQTQQFTSSVPVTWIAKCGTITASGLYTATPAVGTICTIEGIATGNIQYTVYGYDSTIAPVAATFTISPLNPALTEGGGQQFTSSVPASWTASCGSIDPNAGVYAAPLVPGSCTVTANAADGSGNVASTTVTVSSPLAITPATAATGQGQTQQFTANAPVTWAASCGNIDGNGLFTASSASPGSGCTITATASVGAAYTASIVDMIGPAPALTINPTSPTLAEGAAQQFTANVAATWTASCGAIDPSAGVYTAPLAPGSCVVTANAVDGSGSVASTTITIPSPLVISPPLATTSEGQTQQFTANAAVTWAASCGSINSNGLFVALAAPGSSCTLTATAASGQPYTATVQDTIGAPPAFTLSPLSPTIGENATQQFTTSVPATFTASCGGIDPNLGLYTPPLAAGSCTITATAVYDNTQVAFTTATITSPIAITPSTATTPAELTQQFTANMPVAWAASCGTINANGVFTAPISPGGNCAITATASSGPAYTGSAADIIGPAPALVISPLAPALIEGGSLQFTSDIPATFSASCGNIDPNAGYYTAPLTVGACTITATASDGSGNTASTSVTITSPLTVTPASAATIQNQTTQFRSNVPANWAASCGSVDQTGLFTAPASAGLVCQITATAASGTAYTGSALDTVGQEPTLTLSPLNPSLNQAGTQQFTSNIPAAFTASCGSIDPILGLYTAPLISGACTVTATATDGSAQVVSTTVTVTSPLVIQPGTASTSAGLTQQFTANLPANWASSCGAISATGLFTASAAPGMACTVTASASSGTAYTATAIDTIGSAPVLTVLPLSLALSENSTQQFTVNTPATFAASCGSIDPVAGVYTAPLAAGTCTVTATSIYGGGSASATVTVASPITVTPAAASTQPGKTQQFTASVPVVWTTSCGSISSSGLFTASATSGTACSIKATAASGIAYTATVQDVVGAAPLQVNPSAGGLYFTGQVQLTSSTPQPIIITNNQPVPLTFGQVIISPDYMFTSNCPANGIALAVGAACTYQVSFVPQTTGSRPGSLTVNETLGALVVPLQGSGIAGDPGPTVNVEPHAPCTLPSQAQQFTAVTSELANTAVNWWVDGIQGGNSQTGTITPNGLYTAPATAGTHTVLATSQSNSSATPYSTVVTVTASPSLTIYPFTTSLMPGEQQAFQGQICLAPDGGAVSFSVDNIVGGNTTVGTITAAGVYTAPPAVGTHTVRVTDLALNKASGAVATIYAGVSADFDSRSGAQYSIPVNLFGAGRGESLHTVADRSLLTTAGVTVSRLYAQIPAVYATRTPNWTQLDPMIAAIQAAGQKAMLQVSMTPPWLQPAGSCGNNSVPVDVNQWGQLAAAIVGHMDANFPGVVTDYEIWNEPDGGGLCGTTNALNSYLAIYAAAAPLMKAQAANDGASIRVGGPVLASSNPTWVTQLLAGSTTAPFVDFVSYHQYFYGVTSLQTQWDTYNGLNSMYQAVQDTGRGAGAYYQATAKLVAAGKQPLGAKTPIYITEFNANWSFYKECCRNDPTYAPLFNALFITDVLDSVYAGAPVPSKVIYFAGNAYPWLCLIGVQDAAQDCLYSLGSAPAPYPSYYTFQLFATTLGLSGGGNLAKTLTPPAGAGGLVAAAFYTPGQDTIVVINPTPTAYTVPVTFQNPGLTPTQAVLYQIVNGAAIDSSPVAWTPQGTGYTTSLSVGAYSVQAISLIGR